MALWGGLYRTTTRFDAAGCTRWLAPLTFLRLVMSSHFPSLVENVFNDTMTFMYLLGCRSVAKRDVR